MSEVITGSSANFSSTATVPTDGDPRNAASVKTPFQRLLDNSKYLENELVQLGIKKVRKVDEIADLQAINTTSGVADGEVRLIGDDIAAYKGLYIYDASSSDAEDLPWIVQPTTGSGRWFHLLHGIKGANSGLASLDSSGKVVEPVPKRIVDIASAQATSTAAFLTATAPTGVWAVDTSYDFTLSGCKAGDAILIDADFEFASAGANSVRCALAVNGTQKSETIRTTTGTTKKRTAISCVHVVPSDGNYTIAMSILPDGADNALIYGPGTLRATLVRP